MTNLQKLYRLLRKHMGKSDARLQAIKILSAPSRWAAQ